MMSELGLIPNLLILFKLQILIWSKDLQSSVNNPNKNARTRVFEGAPKLYSEPVESKGR
jgi:hypothetical protein